MLFLLSSISYTLAGDICSELDCSSLNHISNFSVDEADERWNMTPRQTRASTYRYISQLQGTETSLEDPQWTPLYWQKYLQTNDLRIKMASLELIHRSHKSKIRHGEYSSLLSLPQIQGEVSQILKEEQSKRDILLMALIECSQVLPVFDQISLHRWLITYYHVVDVSSLSAQALRNIDISKVKDEQREGIRNVMFEILAQSNQPAELIRTADWLQFYETDMQDAVIKRMVDLNSFESELSLRGLRYFEHCNVAQAQWLVRSYDLQKSTDTRVQRLAEKIMQTQ